MLHSTPEEELHEVEVHMRKLAVQNYNEYKFHVSQESLTYVLDVLRSLYGGSDPFPEGIVDSIYFDTLDGMCLRQCENGEGNTILFAII